MELETLENEIGNIGNWKHWKLILETLEEWSWKMLQDKLENGMRNIERRSQKYWRMKLETLADGIKNVGK